MANISLEDFIGTYRDDLIGRCQVKVTARLPPDKEANDFAIPLFLDQLCVQLRDSTSWSQDIGRSAQKHGHDLLKQGFSIDQVVHDYGDVCQSITELAMEMGAPISTDDFRTLNKCLDNAIAGAVTKFTLEDSVTQDKQAAKLHHLAQTAVSAFRAIRAGDVAAGGSTGAVLERTLLALLAALEAQSDGTKQKDTLTPTP